MARIRFTFALPGSKPRDGQRSPLLDTLRIIGLCALAGAVFGPFILGYWVLQATTSSIGRGGGNYPYAGWKSAIVLVVLTAVVMIVGDVYGFWIGAATTVVFGGVLGVLFGIPLAFWNMNHDDEEAKASQANGPIRHHRRKLQ